MTRDLFVIYFHQGYFARFFYLNSGDDPQIFHYEAGLTDCFLPAQEQSFSEYLYSEVRNFVVSYQENILSVDGELKNRVKNYRCHILDVLDLLNALPVSNNLYLLKNAKLYYNNILGNLYGIFHSARYEVYESSYVFLLNKAINFQGLVRCKSQDLTEAMYNLEEEGKKLVYFVKQLKQS